MKHCQSCGLSIGETATFCATCGALTPVAAATQEPALPLAESVAPPAGSVAPSASCATLAAPVAPAAPLATPPATPPAAPLATPPAAPLVSHVLATESTACRLCARAVTPVGDGDVCDACRDDLTLFLAMGAEGAGGVSLVGSRPATGREGVTVSNAIYSALADDDTCPECGAMDGRETNDLAAAATWAPHRHCQSPLGCRCAVFYEHESLAPGEERAFVDYAAAHGLHVTAPAVSAFHDENRKADRRADDLLNDAARSLDEARTLEKDDPQQAVTRYRQAIESLMACGESPLDERRVRHDLPVAFNRLTLVLKALGREGEALEEIDRAAGLGIIERDDCGRKADREALKNRGRRLRERLKVPVAV